MADNWAALGGVTAAWREAGMTRITATAPSGSARFDYRACGSFAYTFGGNHPPALADAIWSAYLALGRKRPDQAADVLRRAGFAVTVEVLALRSVEDALRMLEGEV